MRRSSFFRVFQLGTIKSKERCYSFKVWAPFCSRVDLKIISKNGEALLAMKKDDKGYFYKQVYNVFSGMKYSYILDEKKERPDPASRLQPEGVHGPSEVVDPDKFHWKDSKWEGIDFRDLIFYEMHIATFTPKGTFDAAIKKIPYLQRLGVTCLEIMPVGQFPGRRNWGYDGVGMYAVQNSYGGPEGFKRFVDACHRAGLAVCLDVVYNHLGPEGNYLNDFGPYFTKNYHTPWGEAVNYDDRSSEYVRRFVIENALFWVAQYHVDVLRLDAVHGIYDSSPRHILEELNDAVQFLARKLGRQVHVIAESDLNDPRIIRSKKQGGYGLSGQWNDDFHHAVHAYLTGERQGYYEDFGALRDISKAFKEGFVYDGKYSSFRKRHHGIPIKGIDPRRLVVCVQNHDQVGNRAFGERIASLVDFDKQKLAATLLVLSPNTPLLFMGQEYGEKAPFQYFIDHGDKNLIRAVREGRKKEFAAFGWKNTPDPGAKKTFFDSKLKWDLTRSNRQGCLLRLYRDLISLRKRMLTGVRLDRVWQDERHRWIAFEYSGSKKMRFGILVSFLDQGQRIVLPFSGECLDEIFNTAYLRYGGKITKRKCHTKEIFLPAHCALAGEIKGGSNAI